MKDYEIIKPPFSLEFNSMSKEELKGYYKWYLNIIPERMKILERAVKSTKGYEDWKADYSPDSLIKLGQWFYENVETRKLTEEEIKAVYDNSPEWFREVEIEDWELTRKTISLSIDIGMYLANVFIKNHPQVKWYHCIRCSKNNIDYGKPVLKGFGKVSFEPTNMSLVQAYSIVRGKKKGEGLRRIYDIWSKDIKEEMKD